VVTTSTDRLRTAGLRVTHPRLTVLDVLDAATGSHEHLAVAEVERRARAALGSLSRQTVYDCLEALTRSGLARRIEPAGSPARYEGRAGDNHHHLVCRLCGETTDVDCVTGNPPCVDPVIAGDFVVDEAEVIFWGHCPSCVASPPAVQPM